MRRYLWPIALAVAILYFAIVARAGEPVPRFVSITVENDFFAGSDRHYTNGIQAAFTVSPQAVFAVGQRIYTPADTNAQIPDPSDRPYAGWLYAMGDVRLPSDGTVDHLTLSLGVVGPYSLARQTQNVAHRILGEARSAGWDHQVGSEATVLVGYERAWPAVIATRWAGEEADVSLRVGGDLGNVLAYASTGAVLRYGRNLPLDLPVTHISLGPPRDGYRGTAQRGWYVWAGVDARVVGRNMFIQGNTFRDGPHVGLERYGSDVQAGAALAWPTARVGFTMVRRAREFTGQTSPDRFGQLTVSFAY